jgi:predicted TIM-barrel fold metal-dependent hydrolase
MIETIANTTALDARAVRTTEETTMPTASYLDDVRIIDADTHVIEPADLWTSRVPKKWVDDVPHVVWDAEEEEEVWVLGDTKLYAAGLACGASWGEWPPDHPRRITDSDVRNYDPHQRLLHMDEYGIDAQVLYPNIGVFQVNHFMNASVEPALSIEMVRAYNDFVMDWNEIAPARYIPVMALPFWDRDAALTEMRRAADLGHKGIVLPARMGDFALPDLAELHWDPIWAQAQEMGLSINFHVGSGNIPMYGTENAGKHLNYAWTGTLLFNLNASAIASVIFGGICERFPRLNFVSVESGVGWLPFFVEFMDWNWRNTGIPQIHPELTLLPSEYFARQIYSCFWFESGSAKAAIELLGADHILFETDFPHSTGLTPGPASAAVPPRDHLRANFADVPEADMRKVLYENAVRLYHLD